MVMFNPCLQQRFSSKEVNAAEVLGYSELRSEQADAIEKFVSGRDVIVSLPAGS